MNGAVKIAHARLMIASLANMYSYKFSIHERSTTQKRSRYIRRKSLLVISHRNEKKLIPSVFSEQQNRNKRTENFTVRQRKSINLAPGKLALENGSQYRGTFEEA